MALPATKAKKLSYALQYELDHLPQKIEILTQKINQLESALDDPNLFARDAKRFHSITIELQAVRDNLVAAEIRWLELLDLSQL